MIRHGPREDGSLSGMTIAMLVHEGETRTPEADRGSALSLAAVAGALNTAGFYAVGLYASNMTGNVSAISDRTGTGDLVPWPPGLLLVILFVLGAATSTLLIRRRRRAPVHAPMPTVSAWRRSFSSPLACWCSRSGSRPAGQVLVLGLSFVLGLQNAAVTKISEARVRTTHVTGMITDIGIELARWLDRGQPGPGPLKPHDPRRSCGSTC